MSRLSQLVYTQERWQGERPAGAEVLASCDVGMPIGWIFMFGGRNIWEPDSQIEDRGGTSAERNRYEAIVESADARLGNVVAALAAEPHLWPWYASLQILHRKLLARGKRGYVRIDANWAFKQEKKREELANILAFAENSINLVTNNKQYAITKLLDPLENYCPFVPRCDPDDQKRFKKAKGFDHLEGAQRAAALVVGLPPGDEQRFLSMVAEQCTEAFDTLQKLPPYPVAPAEAPAAGKKPGTKKTPAQEAGVFSKIKGIFGKK